MEWLDSQGIAYKKTEVTLSTLTEGLFSDVIKDTNRERGAVAGTIAAGALAGSTLLGAALGGPLGMIGGGAVAATVKSAQARNSQVRYHISLIDAESNETENSEFAEAPVAHEQSAAEGALGAADESMCGEEVDNRQNIQAKIIEEQMKLIKLKQELAQIQAQISITEGQIEYYNLLLKQ